MRYSSFIFQLCSKYNSPYLILLPRGKEVTTGDLSFSGGRLVGGGGVYTETVREGAVERIWHRTPPRGSVGSGFHIMPVFVFTKCFEGRFLPCFLTGVTGRTWAGEMTAAVRNTSILIDFLALQWHLTLMMDRTGETKGNCTVFCLSDEQLHKVSD